MTQTFYPLTISAVEEQTKWAKRISFELPQALREQFTFKPGQYLTLRFEINGEQFRRSYSICSAAFANTLDNNTLQIGVKRVKGGVVSNHINDKLKVGDIVEVMPPDGRFYADINESQYKTYFLFAAGSGITPMLSILHTVLSTEPHSYVHMLYGNSNQQTIMFEEELKILQQRYSERFILVHSLSSPKSEWSDLWTSNEKKPFREGRVDAEAVKWFISQHPPYAQNAEYYICGPGTMIETVKTSLQRLDVPNNRIFLENFGGTQTSGSVAGVANAALTAQLNGKTITTQIASGKTLLRALLDAGHEPPYSCEGGVCSTCVCTLQKGEVHMKHNAALTDAEVAQGQILSCQSIPLSDKVNIVFK